MNDSARTTPRLTPDENCWRISRVGRGAFLVSGRAYFRAFRRMVLAAERRVTLLAWDLSESIEMVRTPEDDDGYPSRLGEFLFAALDANPDLEIRILLWDYSVVYLAEREWLPFTHWRNPGHPRLHLVTDDALPAGASQHQKIVIIDEMTAFCGGFDLSAWRWDTEEHHAEDPRRRNPKGDAYQPYHDIQVALTGPVVDDLNTLCAMRWERAAGEPLPALEHRPEKAPWPEDLAVDFEDEPVGLALTFARYADYPPSRHIERLHLDVIAAARDYIYIENQYLSTHTIVAALCERLREPDGPEVVIVLTRDAGGWAEEGTLGVLRDRLLELLTEADLHDRLSSRYPHAKDEDGAESQVYVHAKLLIADDRMLVQGSANLSNRSMKVDSEIDLAFLRDEPTPFIRKFLHRLLGIHFGCAPDLVRDALERLGSLRAVIDDLRPHHRHGLHVLEGGCNSKFQRRLADTQLLDPDEPISPVYHIEELLRKRSATSLKSGRLPPMRTLWKLIGWVAAIAIVGLALNQLWGSVIDEDTIAGLLAPLRESPFALPLLVGVFIAAGLLAVPINAVIIGATLAIGPGQAFGCGFVGAMVAAAISYHIGHHLGKPVVSKLAGDKLEALSAAMANRGVWSVAIIRVAPIGPFGLVNLVAGLSSLRFSTFMAGSAIGLFPGIAAVVLVTYQLRVAIENPGWLPWLGFLLAVAAVAGAAAWLRKRFA